MSNQYRVIPAYISVPLECATAAVHDIIIKDARALGIFITLAEDIPDRLAPETPCTKQYFDTLPECDD